MKKLDQAGFSHILLAALLLLVVGGAGFFAYKRVTDANDTYQTPSQSANESNVEETPSTDTSETDGWKEFTPNSKAYSLRLADGWKFTHQNDESDLLYAHCSTGHPDNTPTGDCTDQPGTLADITLAQGGRDGIIGFSIVAMSKDNIYSQGDKVGSISGKNVTGDKFLFIQPQDNDEGFTVQKGTKYYYYIFPGKDNTVVMATYEVLPSNSDMVTTVEKMLSTLSIQ